MMTHTDYSLLAEDKELCEWLVGAGWKGRYDAATINRSRPYTSPRLISEIRIARPTKTGLTMIQATIAGTSDIPYQLMMAVSRAGTRWDLHTGCSCPVARFCKHSAATLALMAEELSGAASQGGDFMPKEISKWLKEVKAAAMPAGRVAEPKKVKPENRFLAYCIEWDLYCKALVFNLRVGTRCKNGGISISDSKAGADLSRPPKYFVTEDFPVVAIHHQLLKNNYRWGELVLRGSGFEELLRQAGDTGRLFYGSEDKGAKAVTIYQIPMRYEPIQPGGEESVELEWEMTEKGGMRPVLKFAEEGLLLIPTIPLRYIREDGAVMGLVKSGHPPEMLLAWSSGPVIGEKNLKAVSESLMTEARAVLPTPKPVDTERREGLTPVAHFLIGKAGENVANNAGAQVTGKLRVKYGDSGLFLPTDGKVTSVHVELRGKKRIVWDRDAKAEGRLVKSLMKVGMVSVGEFLPFYGTGTESSHEYMIDEFAGLNDQWDQWDDDYDDDYVSEKELWIRFLDGKACAALREKGWVIEVESGAGLAIHDVEDFFPEIEGDADHGIDWFSFDIPHEINGRRVSLIPIIAQAIRQGLPAADDPDVPETILVECDDPADGMLRFPTRRLIGIVDQVRHLFHGREDIDGPIRLDRLAAAGVADGMSIDGTATLRALAKLGKNLRTLTSLPEVEVPKKLKADLREYQTEGFRWLQFLSANGLHGILADDMGLGKTLQTLAHLAAEHGKKPGNPSLVIAPTSVAPNWVAEAEKFTPHLKTILWQGKDRAAQLPKLAKADLVITSYPLLTQDIEVLSARNWHVLALDEAQYIKNPKALTAKNACKLNAAHRICLSGTPMENHLGELWSLMRFLMPGFLADEKTFNTNLRKPIERDRSADAQLALNRRVAPLILRRTKDAVAKDLPEKTEIVHGIDLNRKQTDLYESVRAAMDKRVRDAISEKGLAKSHIIVLDALLKLRQICCHPRLLKTPAAQKVEESAKLDFLTEELLPTLIEEGRRILLFSTFTSMLAIIEEHLGKKGIRHLKITGQTTRRTSLVKQFQEGDVPVFLISLKAGGTGLNLTAADTVIHFDPWWNPAAENQATDRAHRIGQTKPVFVHKLVCRGSIEERMLELQKHKSGLVEALLSEETSKLRIDPETLEHLLAPIQ
jgi:hypothetical protein